MNSPLRISVQQCLSDGSVVSVQGELDLSTASTLRKLFRDMIARGCRHVILDLEGVTFVDMSGVTALLLCLKKLRAVDGTLDVASPTDWVRHIFDLTHVSQIVPIYASPEQALTHLDHPSHSTGLANAA